MDLDEFIAGMLSHRFRVYRPEEAPKDTASGGWWVVATDSEYAPGGFSIWVSDAHPVICGAVARAAEQLGFDVQRKNYDHRMEAWPRPAP